MLLQKLPSTSGLCFAIAEVIHRTFFVADGVDEGLKSAGGARDDELQRRMDFYSSLEMSEILEPVCISGAREIEIVSRGRVAWQWAPYRPYEGATSKASKEIRAYREDSIHSRGETVGLRWTVDEMRVGRNVGNGHASRVTVGVEWPHRVITPEALNSSLQISPLCIEIQYRNEGAGVLASRVGGGCPLTARA